MKSPNKTKKELLDELEALQDRVSELERYKINSGHDPENIGERYNQCFPSMAAKDEAIFVVFDRKFEFANDRFAELFGISPEEACDSNFNPLTLIAPESRPFVQEQYREGCRGAFTTKQFNYTGLSKDGLKLQCETFLMFIPYKWGIAVQGMLRGISAGRQIEAALQKSNNDLQVLMSAVPKGVLYSERNLQLMPASENIESNIFPMEQISRVNYPFTAASGKPL
jgi:PAS domain S-box-containing protein